MTHTGLYIVDWVQLLVAVAGTVFSLWRFFDARTSRIEFQQSKDPDPAKQLLATHLVAQSAILLAVQVLLVSIGLVSVVISSGPSEMSQSVEHRSVIVRLMLTGITVLMTLKVVLDHRARELLTVHWRAYIATRRRQQLPIDFPDRRVLDTDDNG